MPKAYGTPGPRILSPDCCTSQSLAECSLGAQLLFDRLLVQSDDQGRQQADAAVVKATCFPLAPDATTKRISAWLAELERAGMVALYRSGKVLIVQLRGWWKYQAGMRRAYPSRWDAPEGWADRVFGVGKDDSTPPADEPHNAGNLPAERAQSAPEIPPHARGSGASAFTGASADARASTEAGARTDEPNRYGLPHIDPETQAVAERVSGRMLSTLHGHWATELDRLTEDRGAHRVQQSLRKVGGTFAEKPSWPQLIAGVRNDLEPLPSSGKPMTEAERKDAEIAAAIAQIKAETKAAVA